ncbi:MAG: amidohydrolase [Clostridiales bacterium]|nr:amidohydrolase [Clostridiales bacterium]
MRKLITNALIITVDQTFAIYKNGMVIIDDDVISYVGEINQAIIDQSAVDEVIDAEGNIIMPGLVNAHTHLPMTLFSGYGSGLPLKEWLEDKIWPAESKLTPNDIYIGTKMGIMQMLLSGTTCFLDMYYFIDDMARAIDEMGIRAVLSRAVMDIGGFDYRLKESIDSIKKYEEHKMIDIMVGPHAVYTNSKEGLQQILEVAKKYNKSMHVHVSETEDEVKNCNNEHGMTPVEYFDELGLFDVPFVAAHCVHVTDNDIKIMANKKVNAVHCPTSNMKLASGIAPIQQMIDAGINVALGTDGSSSNNNVDMFEEMHVAALIGKMKNGDPTALNAKTVIQMATINGAKALGVDEKVGSIEKGKHADLIMMDMKSPFSQPDREFLDHIVYSMGRGQVKMTMIAGKVLQKNGIIKNSDFKKLREQFNNCVDRLC